MKYTVRLLQNDTYEVLNRWNDTLGTKLEDVPKDFIEEKMIPLGWS